jgi:hypothetical protein
MMFTLPSLKATPRNPISRPVLGTRSARFAYGCTENNVLKIDTIFDIISMWYMYIKSKYVHKIRYFKIAIVYYNCLG